MEMADILRGLMISAATLIIGFSLSSAIASIRYRNLGIIPYVPAWATLLFLLGYQVLLLSVIVSRWQSLGDPTITLATKLAFTGLLLNVFSILIYGYFLSKPQSHKPE